MNTQRIIAPSGIVTLRKINPAKTPLSRQLLERAHPMAVDGSRELAWLREYRDKNLSNILRGIERLRVAEQHGVPTFLGVLSLKHLRSSGEVRDYGVVSTRVVTDAGAAFLVDTLQGSVEPEIMKYHGFGTGTTAEAAADTALETEITTGLNPNDTRATGSLGEGATANIFRTVGTATFDASAAVTEHGLFTQAATGGGTMLDRSVFAAINVVDTDQIQATYDFTIASGS